MSVFWKSSALEPLVKARQRAIEDFRDRIPQDVIKEANEYRVLKIKKNEHRRRLKSVWLGVAKQDIISGAGFTYEGTEALSDAELARLEQLEKSKIVLDYLMEEVSFRRDLFRQEDRTFLKQGKKL